jgi:branched-chain amino acid transport system permease protein
MFYRETGQYKTSYGADQALFPIRQDRFLLLAFAVVAFAVIPFVINDYWSKSVMLPFLIYTMVAMGLNFLVGYCGQISLGTGGFMAVGAYASYKLVTSFPELNLILVVLLSGGITAAVGVVFGLPSLRIKGFYLAVATLAAQFFLLWVFNKVPWFYNYQMSQITAPPSEVFGILVTGPKASPMAQYLFVLGFVAVFTWIGLNLVRGRVGRSWMAIRDMDIAAELLGIRPLRTKLLAFAVSSFYIGMGGALVLHIWLGSVEAGEAFDIFQSFTVLFAIIIGGLGSMLGSYFGTAFILLLPIVLKNVMVDGIGVEASTAKHIEFILLGSLIIFFLIKEPHGLARMWQIFKEKLRLWPFPY